MPTYVSLMNLTDKGIREIKDAPKRLEEAVKKLEAMGGKLVGFYTLMGEYDYLGIAEAPNDEVAMSFMIGLGSQGYVRTSTHKAFTQAELAGMLKMLP